jgi:subtilisin family serine protease
VRRPELRKRTYAPARPWMRTAATVVIAVLVSCNLPSATAQPKPRSDEWWFDAWEIADNVWPVAKGDGVTVAVIDTGVAAQLPDLRGAVLPGAGYDGASRKDGRADDDAVKGGHGTAMAALIAGQGLGTGMMGVAPNSKILPISAATDDYERTIPYAVDHGAKVINISESAAAAYCPSNVQAAVMYAVQHDVVVVASAGNEPLEDSTNTPANCKGVLAVGAVGARLDVWSKTSPGGNVMLAAPGVMVGSIGRDGVFAADNSGTSQAAALTSGVVALMRSHFPRMPAREIVQRLLATAKDVGPKGWDKRSGYGALIPYKALTSNVPGAAPNPVYDDLGSAVQGRSGRATPEAARQRTGEESHGSGTWLGSVIAAVVILVGGVGVAGGVFARRRMLSHRKD